MDAGTIAGLVVGYLLIGCAVAGASGGPLDPIAAVGTVIAWPLVTAGRVPMNRPIAPKHRHLLEADRQLFDAELREVHREHRRRLLNLAVLAFVGLWLGLFALIGILSAQRHHAPTDAELLARITVHEAGFDSPADSMLVHEVLLGIVERSGVSYARAAELASPRLARCAVRRRWVCGLDARARRPDHWPMASWAAHRPRWLAALAHAQRVIAGEVPSPCRERPRVWGSRSDVARGRARGGTWIDAGCEGTRNVGGAWR